jgi:uncharacterized protein YwqG
VVGVESKLRDLIESEGLSRRASELLSLAKPSITLQPKLPGGVPIDVGRSKFGGLPDLPSTLEWPMWNSQPLTFIAQIRLSEAAAYDTGRTLTQSGFLFFFYDPLQETWGYDSDDRGSSRVLYFDGLESKLARRAMPPFRAEVETVAPDLEFTECAIEFSPGLCLPPLSSFEIKLLKFSGTELENYMELLECVAELNHGDAVRHRLIGYPDEIQGDMKLQCQLASHGVNCGGPSAREIPLADLEVGAKDWQLLLQIDSDDDLGMMWGDLGRIYYWIHKQDLESRRFENVWLVLQCS